MSNQTISRRDYFLGSLRENAQYSRAWMLRALTVVLPRPGEKEEPWMLKHTKDAVLVYVPGEEGFEWKVLEGVKPYDVPFIYHEESGPMKKGEVANLDRDISSSTWGDLIFNTRVLHYACGNIIPYAEGPIELSKIRDIFAEKMIDDPADGQDVEGQLYVKHWQRFGKAIGDLCGFEFLIPSVTEKALQPPPGRTELRTKLLADNEGRLEDPVVQARIQNELVELYKDNLKGDPSEGFIYKKKSIATALKRMFLIHGPEAGFGEGGRAKLVINSLEEGLDMDSYPDMVNSLRAGSFYRGALTALAGEDVDLTMRSNQNNRVEPGFCGTTDQWEVMPTKEHRYIGRTLNIDGKMVMITEDNWQEFTGTLQHMYSPMYCKQPFGDVCSVCIGKKLADHPYSLGSSVADMPQVMMAEMMGSAHAKELRTTVLDINNFLR